MKLTDKCEGRHIAGHLNAGRSTLIGTCLLLNDESYLLIKAARPSNRQKPSPERFGVIHECAEFVIHTPEFVEDDDGPRLKHLVKSRQYIERRRIQVRIAVNHQLGLWLEIAHKEAKRVLNSPLIK